MIKTLAIANRSERDKFRIPRSVQETIPIREIYSDGIWQVGRKLSRSWHFSDVNYVNVSDEDKSSIFKSYCGILNSLPTDATAKITIVNSRLDPVDFERTVLMKLKHDGLDQYRKENNQILLDHVAGSNHLVQEKYVTLSIPTRNIQQARAYFRRVDESMGASFNRLGSKLQRVNLHDRMRILHNFFRPGEAQHFTFDRTVCMEQGKDFRDLICPDGVVFKAGHFEMGKYVGRVLFLRDYASYLGDKLISNLTNFSRDLMLSIDILPIPTSEAVKDVQSLMMGVDSDINRWQQRQNARQNFSSNIPTELEQERESTRQFYEGLTKYDQRMIFANVTIVHLAETLEQLDADTEALCSIATEGGCQLSVLRYQQEDGLNTVLPYGLRKIRILRTLTTESTAALMPLRAQEIQDPGGIFYGINAISNNLLLCNRLRLNSPHGFFLGISGSGKSMAMKLLILIIALCTDDDIIVIDAEREYSIVQNLGGQIIEISPNSPHHINPLDIAEGYDDSENPVAMKSEIIMSMLEQQMGAGILNGSHKSIIDRCTRNAYRKAKKENRTPLLTDWRDEVLKQPEQEAKELALAAELLTTGSLNVFSHPTDVDMNNRIIGIDLYEMGEQLRPTALVVTLEAIQNRVMANRKKGKYTWVFIDEVYLYFRYHYSAELLYRAWKRFRKYSAVLNAATQNVEECLKSDTARLMLANSEFLMLFNQASTDQQELSKLLHISDDEMGFITDAAPGHGLLRMGGTLVPFYNTIPQDTELYKLMNTSPHAR